MDSSKYCEENVGIVSSYLKNILINFYRYNKELLLDFINDEIDSDQFQREVFSFHQFKLMWKIYNMTLFIHHEEFNKFICKVRYFNNIVLFTSSIRHDLKKQSMYDNYLQLVYCNAFNFIFDGLALKDNSSNDIIGCEDYKYFLNRINLFSSHEEDIINAGSDLADDIEIVTFHRMKRKHNSKSKILNNTVKKTKTINEKITENNFDEFKYDEIINQII